MDLAMKAKAPIPLSTVSEMLAYFDKHGMVVKWTEAAVWNTCGDRTGKTRCAGVLSMQSAMYGARGDRAHAPAADNARFRTLKRSPSANVGEGTLLQTPGRFPHVEPSLDIGVHHRLDDLP